MYFKEDQQPTPDSSVKIFMDALNKNNNIFNLRITFYQFIPKKALLDTIYNMLEKHSSIRALSFCDSYHVDLYLARFLKLKNLTCLNLNHVSYRDYKIFFSNLTLPENFKTFKVDCHHFEENDARTFISILNIIKKSKITELVLGMPEVTKISGDSNPFNLLTNMLKTKTDLNSLVLIGSSHNLSIFKRKKVFGPFTFGKSSIENFCDFLKETKTLKELEIVFTPFMSESYNEKAFYTALSSNRSLTALKLHYIFPSKNDWYANELFDAIFSNPNLKSLKLHEKMNPASIGYLMRILKFNRTLKKFDLDCAHSTYYSDHLFSDMLEENTTLEYCGLRGSGSLCNNSNQLFAEALRKNRARNLMHLKLDIVHPDINAELERNYQLKKLKITNTLLRGVYCKQSPLSALKGFQGPLGLIYGFLYEKESSKKTFETKETKETKEMKELKELQENQEKCVGLKKSREESLMIKQSQAKRVKNCNS